MKKNKDLLLLVDVNDIAEGIVSLGFTLSKIFLAA